MAGLCECDRCRCAALGDCDPVRSGGAIGKRLTLQQLFERGLMEGDLDAFDFMLAESLHITLAEVGAMSNNEYVRWRAWTVYKTAQLELARAASR